MSFSRTITIRKGRQRGRKRTLWYCKKCGRRAYLDTKGGTFSHADAKRMSKECSGCGCLDFGCKCKPKRKKE